MIDRATRPLTDAELDSRLADLDTAFGTHSPTALQNALISLARRSILHRGKFRHLMTHLIGALGRPMDITRMGCNFRIEGRNNLIEYGLLLHPAYNLEEIEFLVAGLGPGKVAVDIGANIGLYGLPMAKAAERLVAIDANPGMVARMRFNLIASGLDNVDLINVAVGERDGRASLHIHKDDIAIVNIVEDDSGPIMIRALASLLDERGIERVDVLKIDVEGHEDKALAPFLETANEARLPDRIVIERVGPDDYPACTAAFDALGYKAVGRTRSNSLYRRDP